MRRGERGCDYVQSDGRNETEHAKAIKVAKGILQSGKLSYEEIAEIAELFIDEVKALDKKVQAEKMKEKNGFILEVKNIYYR